MNKEILFVKGSDFYDVRMQKYFAFFRKKNIPARFWGWERETNSNQKSDPAVNYIFHGGGYGSKRLAFFYLLWMAVVFFRFLFMRNIRRYSIVAVNFDSALPICMASFLRRIPYSYEILDEFALSYNFPGPVKKFVRALDHLVIRRSRFVIHVDANRVNYDKCKYIIIENSPVDCFNGRERDYSGMKKKFAVIGNISATRGIDQIYEFAKAHPDITFLLCGIFFDKSLKTMLLSLPNVEYHEFMPQDQLFALLESCCGIFSLYNPTLEINRLAASNKVYDAMMLGIPVITNREVLNAEFIEKNGFGIVVSYTCDHTWDCLAAEDYLQKAEAIGRNGRTIYLQKYQFDAMLEERFLPMLKQEMP